jgi:hypothetical protein
LKRGVYLSGSEPLSGIDGSHPALLGGRQSASHARMYHIWDIETKKEQKTRRTH